MDWNTTPRTRLPSCITSTPHEWKNISTLLSAIMESIRYFAASGSTVGCQWARERSSPVLDQKQRLPRADARSMNSSQTPCVTSSHLPPSVRRDVASMMSTMPLVKSPPSEPDLSTSATFAPVLAAATAAAKPAGPPPTTTTSVSWKSGTSRAGMTILPSFMWQLGPSSMVCGMGNIRCPNQTLSGSPTEPGGRVLLVAT